MGTLRTQRSVRLTALVCLLVGILWLVLARSTQEAIVVNLPGSPKGATESLAAVLAVLSHALDHLAGRTEHTVL